MIRPNIGFEKTIFELVLGKSAWREALRCEAFLASINPAIPFFYSFHMFNGKVMNRSRISYVWIPIGHGRTPEIRVVRIYHIGGGGEGVRSCSREALALFALQNRDLRTLTTLFVNS
jgi:hypothetical protein